MSLETPVVFLVYRRPEETTQVLRAIAAAAPRRLYVFGDGPRTPGEATKVEAVRALVERGVTWDCQVEFDWASTNLGCRARVVSALDKVFSRESQAIVLEDDCLPSADFFPFCEELLARYSTDQRLMAVNGFNPAPRARKESYFFSSYSLPWGWATWRRAWQLYDRDLALFEAASDSVEALEDGLGRVAARFLRQSLEQTKAGRLDTWDFQWMFSIWIHGGLVARPAANLIRNIGFGDGALHTTNTLHPLANTATSPLTTPLEHPRWVLRDLPGDRKLPLQLFPWLESRRSRLVAELRWLGAHLSQRRPERA